LDSGLSLALSIVIGSLFLVVVMTAQANLHELKMENFLENIAEEKMEATRSVLKWHIEKIGFQVNPNDLPFGEEILFDANNDTTLRFYADIDSNGTADLVELYSGPLSDLAGTENPLDFYLYRKINNNDPEIIGAGLTHLSFTSSRARSTFNNHLEINVLVQTPFPMNYRNNESRYFQAEWREEICPDNLGWY
jgi:hypothetical protein